MDCNIVQRLSCPVVSGGRSNNSMYESDYNAASDEAVEIKALGESDAARSSYQYSIRITWPQIPRRPCDNIGWVSHLYFCHRNR